MIKKVNVDNSKRSIQWFPDRVNLVVIPIVICVRRNRIFPKFG